MHLRALLLTLASLALATPAQAATYAGHVSVRSWLEGDFDIREDFRYTVRQLRYDGDPGAASNLSVRFRSAGRAVISDPRGVQARRGCVQRRRTRVECRARGRSPGSDPAALFVLDDGDDVLRMRGISKNGATLVRAGEGDDVVAGSPGADLIFGGAGADRLRGRGGADGFRGGSAPDGADRISGGGELDEADYSARTGAVHADLEGDADDGEAGELDAIAASVERLQGGTGADELIGDARANRLRGGGGADLLRAGDGDDRLLAAAGSTLDAGSGDDVLGSYGGAAVLEPGPGRDAVSDNDDTASSTIAARDGEVDEIACRGTGDGATVDALDMVAGCSEIAREGAPAGRLLFALAYYGGLVSQPLARRLWWDSYERDVAFTLGCPLDMGARCELRVELRRGARMLLRTRATLDAGALGEFDGGLTKREYRAVRGKPVVARVETTDRDGAAVVQRERVRVVRVPSYG